MMHDAYLLVSNDVQAGLRPVAVMVAVAAGRNGYYYLSAT
jgi:hypothetical protein